MYFEPDEDYLDQLERENEVYLVALNRIANKMPKTGDLAGAMAKVAKDALNEPPEGLKHRLMECLREIKMLVELYEFDQAMGLAREALDKVTHDQEG